MYYGELAMFEKTDSGTIPQPSSIPLPMLELHAGSQMHFGIHGSAALSSEDWLAEAGAFLFLDDFDVHSMVGLGRDGFGLSAQAGLRLANLNLAISLRHISSGDNSAGAVQHPFFTGSTSELNLNATTALGRGTLSWGTRLSRDSDANTSTTHNIKFQRPLFSFRHHAGRLFMEATRDNDDLNFLFGIEYNFSNPKYPVRIGARIKSNHQEVNGVGQSSLDSQLNLAFDEIEFDRWSVANNVALIRERGGSSVNNLSQVHSSVGDARLEYSRSQNPGGKSVDSYNISATSNIANSGRHFSIGGGQIGQSGILVHLEGPADKEISFELLVNQAPLTRLYSGQRRLISLLPYKNYTIKLKPMGKLSNFEHQPKKVTLYPGNIHTLTWVIEPVRVAIGQLVDLQGQSLPKWDINSSLGVGETDENGWFQIEVGLDPLLKVSKGGEQCRATIPEAEGPVESIQVIGSLLCQ